MSNYNFTYDEMGFHNEQEMKDSIKRVEHLLSLTTDERKEKEMREKHELINRPFSLAATEESVRLKRLDEEVRCRIEYERKQEKLLKQQQERQAHFNKLDNIIQEEESEKARQEYEKEQEKLNDELALKKQELNEKYNTNIHGEESDKDLRDMLKNLNTRSM